MDTRLLGCYTGAPPICHNRATLSNMDQCSTNLPPATRLNSNPVKLYCAPCGRNPLKHPSMSAGKRPTVTTVSHRDPRIREARGESGHETRPRGVVQRLFDSRQVRSGSLAAHGALRLPVTVIERLNVGGAERWGHFGAPLFRPSFPLAASSQNGPRRQGFATPRPNNGAPLTAPGRSKQTLH
jgi:hypothetical protein